MFVLFPAFVGAQGLLQGISGSLEFDYSSISTKLTDSLGNTSKTESKSYNPRFTLNIDTRIYPNLRLHAGGQAEVNGSDFTTDGLDTKTTVTRFRPYVDLTLENPLYKVGVGYNRREEETKTRGFPAVTLINEEYYNVLGWRPDGLPSIDMQIRRTKNFDEEELVRDVTEDYYNLRSRYRYQGLQLYYDGTLINTKEDLVDLDVRQQIHSGDKLLQRLF
jgi:hypothetical protein